MAIDTGQTHARTLDRETDAPFILDNLVVIPAHARVSVRVHFWGNTLHPCAFFAGLQLKYTYYVRKCNVLNRYACKRTQIDSLTIII